MMTELLNEEAMGATRSEILEKGAWKHMKVVEEENKQIKIVCSAE